MPIDVNLQSLINLRERMGAPLAKVNLQTNPSQPRRSRIEIELLERGRVVIDASQLEENRRNIGGLLAFGDTHITLHIYHPFKDREELEQVPASDPKFHLADCRTLEQMRARGRYNRYVPSIEQTGTFPVQAEIKETGGREEEEIQAHLLPCRNCLSAINYEGYRDTGKRGRDQIVNDFDLELFFETYESIFRTLPRYTPETIGEGQYTSDWAEVSVRIRNSANWTCEKCGVNCTENRGLLHAHHIDGNRGNNRRRNIKVLCIVCHQQEPFHQRMRVTSTQRAIIQRLRIA